MVLLNDVDREQARAKFTKELSDERAAMSPVTKAQTRLLANAVDNFLDGERTNFVNNYLVPAGLAPGDFTAREIARMFVLVIRRRFLRGS